MIEGVEWLFIFLIVILLFLYEPQKISQIAKAIAQARKEYEKASSTIMEQIEKESKKEEEKEEQQKSLPFEHDSELVDVDIIKLAKMFKIQTYGKTREELTEEVIRRIREYFSEGKDHKTLQASLSNQTVQPEAEIVSREQSKQISDIMRKE
ncbi:MAG: hypothetical protein ABDH32_07530 [Candidatus Caldarchaeales archaeon]